jgi:hypothetical protein
MRRIGTRFDQRVSGVSITQLDFSSRDATEVGESALGVPAAWRFLSRSLSPSIQLLKAMKVRSDCIQPSSEGVRPSRFNGITKFSFRSRPRQSALVLSFTGLGFLIELRERTAIKRCACRRMASSISMGYDSPPSSLSRSHQTLYPSFKRRRQSQSTNNASSVA